MKQHNTKIPILNIPLTVIEYVDGTVLQASFKHHRFETDFRDIHGCVFEINNRIYIALCNDGRLTHGTISHECKHVVNTAYNMVGAGIDSEDDEIECYFLMWVADAVYKYIDREKVL